MRLEVTLPLGSKVTARELLNKKRTWIEREVERLKNRKRVFDGRNVLLRGIPHRLKVLKAKQNWVSIKGGAVYVGLGDGSDLRQCIKDWMTHETRRYVTRRINYYATTLGLSAREVQVGDSRRWGYCTRDRKLVFNWQIAALPRELADYVILHEVSHTSEFNHDRRFRARLLSLCPDFIERERSLRDIMLMTS
jgi:predicted metal-dependent hydrolase